MGSPDFYNIYCVYSVNNRWWTPSSPPFLSLSLSLPPFHAVIFHILINNENKSLRNKFNRNWIHWETMYTVSNSSLLFGIHWDDVCTPYQNHHRHSTPKQYYSITSTEFFLSFRSKVFMCETVTQDGTWWDEASQIKAGRTNWSRLKYHQRYTKKNLILDFIINTLNASSSSPRQQLNN